jgi:hypothetical protein
MTAIAILKRLPQSTHEVAVFYTSVKDSTLSRLPMFSIANDLEFPAKDVMEIIKTSSSAAALETMFISQRLRISLVQGMTLVLVRDSGGP